MSGARGIIALLLASLCVRACFAVAQGSAALPAAAALRLRGGRAREERRRGRREPSAAVTESSVSSSEPPLLAQDTLSSAELRSLAELVCEGQTLELVDDTLLDSLRDALRCAALAAREVSPENA